MKARKILAMVAALALTAALAVGGTLAYLTSTDSVTNTFTVGNVVITLDETDVDNSTDNADRDKANSYKLLPGHEYTKDPIIHVDANSEDCYLFVRIANDLANIEDPTNTVAAQMAGYGWTQLKDKDGNDVTGVFCKENPVSAADSANVKVFDTVKIAGTVTNTQLAAYANKTITVTAYAVQADGFSSATAAWTAAAFGA